jgi:hypothetical protein
MELTETLGIAPSKKGRLFVVVGVVMSKDAVEEYKAIKLIISWSAQIATFLKGNGFSAIYGELISSTKLCD